MILRQAQDEKGKRSHLRMLTPRIRETVRDSEGRVVGRIAGWRMDGSPVVVPKRRWRLLRRAQDEVTLR